LYYHHSEAVDLTNSLYGGAFQPRDSSGPVDVLKGFIGDVVVEGRDYD